MSSSDNNAALASIAGNEPVDKVSRIELSVIIVSYKNYSVLRDCLSSIEKFNDIGTTLEVIVVEQSPQRDVYESLSREFPWVHTVRHENRGFGAGNNAGVEVSKGKYLLFLNPDTTLLEPVFRFAVERFESNSKLGLFGVRLVDNDGNRNQSFYFKRPFGLLRGSVLYRACDKFNIFIPKAMYITGADMFMRADAFKEIGGFDERMFMYFEETYLCERLEAIDMRVAYFPEKRIVHLEGQSSVNINVFKRRLDSLEILCEDLKLDYCKILRRMVFDRKVKAVLGSDRSARQSEITEIEHRLIEDKDGR